MQMVGDETAKVYHCKTVCRGAFLGFGPPFFWLWRSIASQFFYHLLPARASFLVFLTVSPLSACGATTVAAQKGTVKFGKASLVCFVSCTCREQAET